jgi:hypothetical protein
MLTEIVEVGFAGNEKKSQKWHQNLQNDIRQWLKEIGEDEPKLIQDWEKLYTRFSQKIKINFSVRWVPRNQPVPLGEHIALKHFTWTSEEDRLKFMQIYER